MPSQHDTQDRPYRRGLVLGLSLAEVFLILLFLLLVVSMNIVETAKQDEVKYQNELNFLNELKSELFANGADMTMLDFTTELINFVNEATHVKEQAILLDPITQAINNKQLDSESINGIVNDISSIIDNTPNKLLPNAFEMSFLELQEQNKGLIQKIEDTGVEKGELPPCWYVTIDRKDDPEREIKIFDILISDLTIIVNKRESAEEIKRSKAVTNFGNEFNTPQVSTEKLGKPVSYESFTSTFKTFYNAGEERKIQPYRCRFFVGLWDNTSNKSLYKKRKALVENLFYKYEYSSAWPYSDVKPKIKQPINIESNEESDSIKTDCGFLGLFCKENNKDT